MNLPRTNFELLEDIPVYDQNSNKVGILDDLVVKLTAVVDITKIVVKDPESSGMLSSFDFTPDDRLVIPMAFVDQFKEEKVILSLNEEVATKLVKDQPVMLAGEYHLKDLMDKTVQDASGESLGRIKNLLVHDELQLVIGDGFFEELLEDVGLLTQTDLLLQLEEIVNIGADFIQLKQEKSEYEEILNEKPEYDEPNTIPSVQFPLRTHPPF